jgi:hypothetical protein
MPTLRRTRLSESRQDSPHPGQVHGNSNPANSNATSKVGLWQGIPEGRRFFRGYTPAERQFRCATRRGLPAAERLICFQASDITWRADRTSAASTCNTLKFNDGSA